MKSIIICSVFLLLLSCNFKGHGLTDEDKKISKELGFDESLLTSIRNQTDSAFSITDGNPDNMELFRDSAIYAAFKLKGLKGLTFSESEKNAKQLVENNRSLFAQKGYFIFISETNFGYNPDMVTILKTTDKYDILKFEGTCGINYDIYVDDVITRLQKWDSTYKLDIFSVGYDFIEAKMLVPPSDMKQFSEEVYEFCPDIVDQGTGTVDALVSEMTQTSTLYLWWD